MPNRESPPLIVIDRFDPNFPLLFSSLDPLRCAMERKHRPRPFTFTINAVLRVDCATLPIILFETLIEGYQKYFMNDYTALTFDPLFDARVDVRTPSSHFQYFQDS